jgi:5-methylcytosine-specific restriction enzyme subunit McrC
MVVPDRRVIHLHEREPRIFPRTELFDAAGNSLLLSDTRELSAVALRDLAEGIEVRALGLIGYLPLTETITLNLRPKFPIANLWEMLSLADEAYERILPVMRSYDTSAGSPPHQLLVLCFCHYLKDILRHGMFRTYYKDPTVGYYKPKIHFGRTVSQYLAKGDPVTTASDSFVFSSRVPINGVLKSACLAFLRMMPRTLRWQEERAVLSDALRALERCTPVALRPGEEHSVQNLPMWLRRPYYNALNVYGVLLGYNQLGFSFERYGQELPSFLFKLDDIFESFIRNTFRANLREKKISVTDGNLAKNHVSLFVDTKTFRAKPDVIFRSKGKILGLAEVKYKPGIEESDRYQLIAHVLAAGAPVGVWISPAMSAETTGLEYIGATGGRKFYHYTFDVGARHLSVAGKLMTQDVFALMEAA